MWAFFQRYAYSPYYQFRRFIPSKLLYHPDYFQVLSILKESKSNFPRLKNEVEKQLRAILYEAVAHVPYYRDTVKIALNDIAHHGNPYDLIQEFPYLEKSTVMEQQHRFLNERYRGTYIHYVTSGGSTGQGIGLWRNKRLADIEKAFFADEWGQFGFSFERSRYLRIGVDARRKIHEYPLRQHGNRLMLSPYHITEQWRAEILTALNAYQPEYIHSYPSALFELCKLLEKSALHFKPKAILLASEPALDYQLAAIEQKFNCPISFNYGLTERTNIAFGTYIKGERSDNRMNPLYGFSENREQNGQPEIVGTSLWNDVMPLIRYCTADFGHIENDGKIKAIEGRAQEFLISRHGSRIPGLSILIDQPTWDFVKYYQVRQCSPGAISIHVVPKKGTFSEAQKQFLIERQLQRWGGFFDITLKEVKDIPLTAAGKRRLVVSELAF